MIQRLNLESAKEGYAALRWSGRAPLLFGWLWLSALAAAGPGMAGENVPQRLTLPQAAALAGAHSPILLESEANAQAARQAYTEARVSWLPGIEAREVALRTNSPADAFGLQLMQERFDFPAFTRSDPNNPDAIDNYATELEASMPLFTGGRIRAGIGQAKGMSEAAGEIFGHTRSAVLLAVANAYMDVLLADRAADLAAQARKTTEMHVDQAQAFFDAGMLVESDLLQAKVQLARMDEELIRARNNARLARAGLNRAMGVDLAGSYALDPEIPEMPQAAATLEEASTQAMERRADLRAAGLRTKAAALGVRRAQGEYFPEIGIRGKYSLNGDSPFSGHGDSYTLMAVARWDLWNWGRTRARVARSRVEREAAAQAERAYRQQVEFEVRSAWQSVDEARARHEVASKAVASAERALSILEERFGQEVARVTDLLDAETMTNEARLRELQARFDLQRATRALQFATGLPPVPEVLQ